MHFDRTDCGVIVLDIVISLRLSFKQHYPFHWNHAVMGMHLSTSICGGTDCLEIVTVLKKMFRNTAIILLLHVKIRYCIRAETTNHIMSLCPY